MGVSMHDDTANGVESAKVDVDTTASDCNIDCEGGKCKDDAIDVEGEDGENKDVSGMRRSAVGHAKQDQQIDGCEAKCEGTQEAKCEGTQEAKCEGHYQISA